jgi:hypothetical protein
MTGLKIEMDGHKYWLRLNSEGLPYVLKQQKASAGGFGNRLYWANVWASWYKGLPTGARARAIEAMGFVWRRDNVENFGWHKVPRIEGR